MSAYTNCDELELYLNGKSMGKKQIEKYGHGEWEVCYEPGELKVEAFKQGTLVCQDIHITSGKAERLALRLDNKITKENGVDIAVKKQADISGYKTAMLANTIRMMLCILIGVLIIIAGGNINQLRPTPTLLAISALSGIATSVFVASWLVVIKKCIYDG